jgi:hypothetical protein
VKTTVVIATVPMSGTSGTRRAGNENPTPSESRLIEAEAASSPRPDSVRQ